MRNSEAISSNIGKTAHEESRGMSSSSIGSRYLLLSALGIYTIHKIARDLLHSAIKEGSDYTQKKFFEKKLQPIRKFDWNAKTLRLPRWEE